MAKELASTETNVLLDRQRELEAEKATLRRGQRVGTRLGAHTRAEESFAALDREVAKFGGAVRHYLATSGPLPADMLTRMAALLAARQDKQLRKHLHELVEREPLRGEHDPFDKVRDPWPVRTLEEIEAELEPIATELAARQALADAKAELEALEDRKTGLLARIGGDR